MPSPLIPATFSSKKAKILRHLSIPDSEYNDRSPKGSVDERIRELIDEINAYEGFVTTSSCAGRISVFQEGNGKVREGVNGAGEVGSSGVPGGKGGGKFLFVSHEPIEISEDVDFLAQVLGPGAEKSADGAGGSSFPALGQRFVRFAFEPMVCRRGHQGTRRIG
jgi:tRNA wybutosine-synthesizing protein 3